MWPLSPLTGSTLGVIDDRVVPSLGANPLLDRFDRHPVGLEIGHVVRYPGFYVARQMALVNPLLVTPYRGREKRLVENCAHFQRGIVVQETVPFPEELAER